MKTYIISTILVVLLSDQLGIRKIKAFNFFTNSFSNTLPFFMWIWVFTYIICLLSKEFILTVLWRYAYWQQIPSTFVCPRKSLFFQDFKYFSSFSSFLHGFWEEVGCNSLLFYKSKVVFPLLSFIILSKSWIFFSKDNMPKCSFLGNLSCLVSELLGSVLWCLIRIWGKFSVIISNIVSFSSLVFLLGVCYKFVVAPQCWDVVFFSLCSICFLVFRVSTELS